MEHWLEEPEIGYFNLTNYNLVSEFCRKTNPHGGSCIYVKCNIHLGKKVIIVGEINTDFNINMDRPSKITTELLSLLNSYGLSAAVDVLTRITKKKIETGVSDPSAQILNLCNLFPNIKHKTKNYRIVRSSNEVNIQYLNFILHKESWVNDEYNEFILTFNYYYETDLPKKKVHIQKQKPQWVTTGIRETANA
ncbi:hypothetical protein C0J52_20391 [Blattella germanica]|nr:hypothetical protein C0J52_20391 [Blattella germanica]